MLICGLNLQYVTSFQSSGLYVSSFNICRRIWSCAVIDITLSDLSFTDTLRIESRLLEVLPEYLNNEIVMQTVNSRTSALEHLSRSYLGQRLISNLSYYLGFAFRQTPEDSRLFLLDKSLRSLEAAGCIILQVCHREVNNFSSL
jgi:hypothetical protein